MLCSAPILSAMLAAAGCGVPAPPDPTGRLIAPPSAALIRLDDRLEASGLTLSAGNLPAPPPERLAVRGWELDPEPGPGGETSWRAPLPVRLPLESYFARPELLTAVQGDTELPFCNLPGEAREGCWDISRGHLEVVSRDEPGSWEPPLELALDGSGWRDLRMDPAASGLAPLDYARGELTLHGDTRSGLWLPAPSEATWALTLPEGARLTLYAGLAEPAAAPGRSDGATLEVTVDGVPIASLALEPGEPFTPLEVDLSSRAGQAARLGLRTRPGPSSELDFVFVAEPLIRARAGRAPRRVVLVGIDTLRADALSQSGYSRDTTAPLDAFAASCVRFERTWTPAPRTRPSFQAALSGRWPGAAEAAPTLGERLRAAGFVTAGFAANVQLHPRFGFHRGYDLWRLRPRRDAAEQLADAAAWLAEQGEADALAFVHLMDPHLPYGSPPPHTDRYVSAPPDSLRGDEHRWAVLDRQAEGRLTEADRRWLRARYDGEIRAMAEALAAFLAALDALPGETLVAVFSDHGEEFWDHGSYEHNHSLYEELVRGVLWWRLPGGAGVSRDEPVGTIDLVPTVLALLGIAHEPLDGRSLVPLLAPQRGGEGRALSEALAERPLALGHLMYDRERWGVVSGGAKYLLETWTGREALYDLRADPREQRSLTEGLSAPERAAWAARLEAATGAPAGAGWRLHLSELTGALELTFSRPVRAASVLDPEAARRRRANRAWGEEPDRLPGEVGTLQLSEDRRSLRFTPGIEPAGGVIGIIFQHPETGAHFATGGHSGALPPAGGALTLGPGVALRAEPGVVILPGAERPEPPAEPAARRDLEALGYLE